MNPLFVTMLGSLLRMALLGVFGGMIQRGVWTEAEVTSLALGLAGFLATAIWALWNHYRTRLKFLMALEAPLGTREDEIDAVIKAGQGVKP
jgi:hypothetical protein